jgi:hypothetical protein
MGEGSKGAAPRTYSVAQGATDAETIKAQALQEQVSISDMGRWFIDEAEILCTTSKAGYVVASLDPTRNWEQKMAAFSPRPLPILSNGLHSDNRRKPLEHEEAFEGSGVGDHRLSKQSQG